MAEVVELEAVEPEFDAVAMAAGAEQLANATDAAAGDTTLQELELVEQVKLLRLTSLVISPPLPIFAAELPYSNSLVTALN